MTILQTCTFGSHVCAQYAGPTQETSANAEQNVEGSSGNTTVVSQDASGDSTNQDADVDDVAATDIDAAQNTAADSTTTILQLAAPGTGSANQAATTASTTTSNSTMNVTGTSNNNTTIIQQ